MKRRVAIWLYGGIGTGNFSQGQPLLEKLIQQLSDSFEIIVYSQSLVNPDYVPSGFRIICAGRSVKNQRLRWLLLFKYFLKDHFQKKHSLIVTFWGFPGGFLATCLAKVLRLPSMVNLQGGDSTGIPALDYGVMHRFWYRQLASWTYRKATVLTVLTHFQKELLREYGIQRPIEVISLGVDPSIFHVSPSKKSFQEPYHFLHVSNYSPIKDPETLFRSFSLISKKKESRLRIVGGDYDTSNAKELCRSLGIEDKVDFSGPLIYAGLPEQYEWADVLLHTSLFEGQGIVIAEAAMTEVLIAGTAVGLIADLGEQRAIVVATRDFQALATKVLESLDNPDAVNSKLRSAHLWSLEHDFIWTLSQYEKIINELITA